jgi:hypothetical protein
MSCFVPLCLRGGCLLIELVIVRVFVTTLVMRVAM